MSVSNLARKFLVACAVGKVEAFINYGDVGYLFRNVEKEDWDQFYGHVRKHGSLPSPSTIKNWWDDVPKVVEPASFYHEAMKERHFAATLADSVDEANQLVQKDRSEDAAMLLVRQLSTQLLHTHGSRLIDMQEAYSIVQANYGFQFKAGDEYGMKIGYPVVDDYGGILAGDMMSIVGRPQAGKSFLTLRAAHNAWQMGHTPVYISMEMNNLLTGQRLVAMDAGVPLNALKLQKGQGLTSPQMAAFKAAAKHVQKVPNRFYLMDGNLSTTVEDIYSFCRQMNPTCVIVDGAYMLKHPDKRLGRFERVAENCELLKQEIAGNLGLPVIASWQFSREAAKKMTKAKQTGKAQPIGLEDIGYSDSIGQISTIVLGLMEEETVQNLHRKKVTVMKGRNGETGEFDINWQFNPLLNFDVWSEEKVDGMGFA